MFFFAVTGWHQVRPRQVKQSQNDSKLLRVEEDEPRCAFCNKVFPNEDEWGKHTPICAKEKGFKKFRCQECIFATYKPSNQNRHNKRIHQNNKISEDDEKGKDSPSDWETQYSRSMDKIIGVGDSDADESSYEDDPRKESATGDGTADQGKMTRRWHRK